MGLPAKRRTKQSKRERASHFALRAAHLVACSHCKRRIPPHRVCGYCGYYRGKPVPAIVARLDAAAAKRHRRHQHSHEEKEEAKGAKASGKREKKDGTETDAKGTS